MAGWRKSSGYASSVRFGLRLRAEAAAPFTSLHRQRAAVAEVAANGQVAITGKIGFA